MGMHGSRWNNQDGVTLLELMVAGFITIGVAAAGFAVVTATERAHTSSGQTVESQQNARVALEMMSQDIRQAGFGMVGPVGNCNTAIVPGDHTIAGPDRGPDRISLVVPTGNPVGTVTNPAWVLQNAIGAGFNLLTVSAASVLTDIQNQLDVTTLVGATVTLEGTATRTVTAAAGTTITVTPDPKNGTDSFRANTPIHFLQCITYQVIPPPDANQLCDGRFPCLVRGGATLVGGVLDCNTPNSRCRPVADEIEDIQFAYACDGCNAAVNGGVRDDVIDNQGGAAGFDQADFVTDNAWNAGLMTPDKIRLVQVSVVGRQRVADQGSGEGMVQSVQSQVLQVSDHNHAAGLFAAGDFAGLNPAYTSTRRRLVTRTVEVRNLRG